MRLIKLALSAILFYVIFFMSLSPVTSCTKTVTVHDTTIKSIHDTTIITDTVYDLVDGLIAYYNFTGGSLTDGSGYHNDIVFNNATKATDRFGNSNNAYLFDGASSYMRVLNSSSLNPSNITMMAIVKVNGFYSGTCSQNQILCKGYPYNVDGFYQMGFYDFSPSCGPPNVNSEHFWGIFGDNNPQGTAPSTGTDTVSIQTGEWYNVVFTYNGVVAKLYINGQLKSATSISGAFTKNTQDLLIGKHENPPFPYWFNGIIDEIRIYNRALPPGAVAQLNNLKE
ncbi:MAG: LamG domain-containing protein [Bacteroidetes bacterium]|nr:LamG domain-containing protein [Bacteroidota bacterium]